jgi:hypothetical protein
MLPDSKNTDSCFLNRKKQCLANTEIEIINESISNRLVKVTLDGLFHYLSTPLSLMEALPILAGLPFFRGIGCWNLLAVISIVDSKTSIRYFHAANAY